MGQLPRPVARTLARLPATNWQRNSLLAAFVIVVSLFSFSSYAAVEDGLNEIDDAYLAMAAKSLATGRGYGVPKSSEEFVPFDVNVTTGPPMIVPLAIVSQLLGSRDRVPGAVALALFILQIAVTAILLGRAVGWLRTLAFLGAFGLLLLMASRTLWLYGVFMGEPVAAGFVLLMAVTLALSRSRRGALGAGVWGSLAVLTKLIAGFAVAAMAVVFAVLELRRWRRGEGDWRRIVLLGLGLIVPALTFEGLKLSALGVEGYIDHWRQTLVGSGALARGPTPESPSEWVTSTMALIDATYINVALLGLVVAAAVVFFAYYRDAISGPVRTIAVFIAVAVIAHMCYMAIRVNLQQRYLFIAVFMLMAALALVAPMLRASYRPAFLGALFVAGVVLDPRALFVPRATPVDEHAERLAAVSVLDEHHSVPYFANHWVTIYGFVYPRRSEGTFACCRDATRYYGQRVLAVADRRFSRLTPIPEALLETHCASLTPTAQRLLVYDCAEPYWNALSPRVRFAAGDPFSAVDEERRAADGGGCNIDYFRGIRTGTFPPVVDTMTIAVIEGWAGDTEGGTANEALAIALRGTSGSFHAPLRIDERPDIADHFGKPQLARSGLTAALTFEGVPPGDYGIDIHILTPTAHLRCDSRMVLSVK